jgi:uncharacterized protein (TIGR03437 family)
VLNAATFTGDFSPGGLISIFGAGFVVGQTLPRVKINDIAPSVLAALPFQINAQIPLNIPAGNATLSISAGNSTLSQPIVIKDVAPAIFVVAPGVAAITNQDNSLNTPSNPAPRTQAIVIYGTGLGVTVSAGALNVARTPVTVVIGGTEIVPAFAGATPQAPGLYQVNVVLPATLPPGLELPLFLKQGSAISNTVLVSVQ